MAVKYHAVAKRHPGIVGGGEIKYYASIIRGDKATLRGMLDEIAELSVTHPGAVLAVLEVFLLRVNYHLTHGRAVELGQLGTFYPSISSTPEDSKDEVRSFNIRRFKVNFRPSKLLKKRLSVVEFVKESDDTAQAPAA